jgi:hypothetical protein
MRASMGDDRRSASCGERCSRDGSWSGSTDAVDDERPGDDGRWPMRLNANSPNLDFHPARRLRGSTADRIIGVWLDRG